MMVEGHPSSSAATVPSFHTSRTPPPNTPSLATLEHEHEHGHGLGLAHASRLVTDPQGLGSPQLTRNVSGTAFLGKVPRGEGAADARPPRHPFLETRFRASSGSLALAADARAQ